MLSLGNQKWNKRFGQREKRRGSSQGPSTAHPADPLLGSQRVRSLSSTFISRSKRTSMKWVRGEGLGLPRAMMGSGQQCRGTKEASAVRQIQSRHAAVTTVHTLTKAKPTRPPPRVSRLHSSKCSPSPTNPQNPKQGITRKESKLNQRWAQEQWTPPRAPEQPLPNLSQCELRCLKSLIILSL